MGFPIFPWKTLGPWDFFMKRSFDETRLGSQELIFWAVAFPTEAWLQWLTDGSRVPGVPGVPGLPQSFQGGSPWIQVGTPGGKNQSTESTIIYQLYQ